MLNVVVEKLIYGGKGLARIDGLPIFIPKVIPGETVSIDIVKKGRDFADAKLVEILTPSPDRTNLSAMGEEELTGASWAHISYSRQLSIKEEIFTETLLKIGKIKSPHILPIISSNPNTHYRLRVQLNVRYKDGAPMIGFFREGTHELVEVKNGILLHPLINKLIDAIRKLKDLLPLIKEIHINISPDGEAILLFFSENNTLPSMSNFFISLKEAVNEVVGIVSYANREKCETLGRNFINLKLDGYKIKSSEGNFFQVNWEQNKQMIKTVLEFLDLNREENLLDLYCGIGNFSIPLSKYAGRVIGIEVVESSFEDAKQNIAMNNLYNIEFLCDDVRKGLKEMLARHEKGDKILLDPPRAGGTKKIIERIMAFNPKKIVYVSCNPTTLARDINLFQAGGYDISRIQPIDMFPHTYHLETVTELIKK